MVLMTDDISALEKPTDVGHKLEHVLHGGAVTLHAWLMLISGESEQH